MSTSSVCVLGTPGFIRDPERFDDRETLKILGENDTLVDESGREETFVAGDATGQKPRYVVTADFVYVRLRRPKYAKKDLDRWQEWIAEQSAANRDVLLYLKHDDTAAAPKAILARWPD